MSVQEVYSQSYSDIQSGREKAIQATEQNRKDLILSVIMEYQTNNNPNPTGLSNEQIVEKIFEWYNTPPRPEITKDILIQKYLDIVKEPVPTPEPITDETLNLFFN